MPGDVFGEDFAFLRRAELLTFEEIARVSRVFAEQGVEKIRLTGGEPLLRRDLERLVEMLARLDGVRDIALTTNGAALAAKAQSLRAAGLARVNVSLDALEDDVFGAINGVSFPVARVLEGIDAAIGAGLSPVKVNMVVKRGVNDGCIVAMAEHFRWRPVMLRFIEYMDVGSTNGWRADDVVPAAEIHALIDSRWPLEALPASYPGEVARRFRYGDGAGQIGLIASVTQPFCGGCTRARLSADGKLYTCLFAATGNDLRARLREGVTDRQLAEHIGSVWSARADRYSETRASASAVPERIEMFYIGG